MSYFELGSILTMASLASGTTQLAFGFLVDFTRADPQVLLGLTMVQVLYIPAILTFGYQLWASYRASRQAKAAAPEPLPQAV